MNMNRKRQALRRRIKDARAQATALDTWEFDSKLEEAATFAHFAANALEEIRQINLTIPDPMDILDITQIGAGYPAPVEVISGTITSLPGHCAGWRINLS